MTSVEEPLYRPDIRIPPTAAAAEIANEFFRDNPEASVNDVRRELIDRMWLGGPEPETDPQEDAMTSVNEPLYRPDIHIPVNETVANLVVGFYRDRPTASHDDLRRYLIDVVMDVWKSKSTTVKDFTPQQFLAYHTELQIWEGVEHQHLMRALSHNQIRPDDTFMVSKDYPAIAIVRNYGRDNHGVGPAFVGWIDMFTGDLWWVDPMSDERKVKANPFHNMYPGSVSFRSVYPEVEAGEDVAEVVNRILDERFPQTDWQQFARDQLANSDIGKGFSEGLRQYEGPMVEKIKDAFRELVQPMTQGLTVASQRAEALQAVEQTAYWSGETIAERLRVLVGNDERFEDASSDLNQAFAKGFRRAFVEKGYLDNRSFDEHELPHALRRYFDWLGQDADRLLGFRTGYDYGVVDLENISLNDLARATSEWMEVVSDRILNASRNPDTGKFSLGSIAGTIKIDTNNQVSLEWGEAAPAKPGPDPEARTYNEVSWESETRCPHSISHGEYCRDCPDRIAQPSGLLAEATEDYVEDFTSLDAASTPEELEEVAEMEIWKMNRLTIVNADGTETSLPGGREFVVEFEQDTETMGDSMFPEHMVTSRGPIQAVALGADCIHTMRFNEQESADFERFVRHALESVDHLPKPSEDNVFVGHYNMTINGLADGPVKALCEVYVAGDGEMRIVLPQYVHESKSDDPEPEKPVDLDVVAVYGTPETVRSLDFVFTNDETIKLTGPETYLALLEYVNRRELAEDNPDMTIGPAILEAIELFDTEWMERTELATVEDAEAIDKAKQELVDLVESLPIFYDKMSLHQETTVDEEVLTEFEATIEFTDDTYVDGKVAITEPEGEIEFADSETGKTDPGADNLPTNLYGQKVLNRLIEWWEENGPMVSVEGLSIDEAFIRYIEELQDYSADLADFLIGCIPGDVLAATGKTHPVDVAKAVIKHYVNHVEVENRRGNQLSDQLNSADHRLALFEATETLAFSFLADFFQIANKAVQAQRYSDNIGSPEVRKVLDSIVQLRAHIQQSAIGEPIADRWSDQEDRRVQAIVDRTRRNRPPIVDPVPDSAGIIHERSDLDAKRASVLAELRAEMDAYVAQINEDDANRPREN